jgi:hypothetical protein
MGNLHLPVTKAIRPLCVPIATTLAVFSVDSTAPHGPAAVLLLCLTTTPDYHCTLLPLTRIFPSRIECLSRVKAQQRYASIPYFSSFLRRCPKLRSHSRRCPHARPLLLSSLLLLLLDEASNGRNIWHCPLCASARACMPACMAAAPHQRSVRSAAAAGRQGKTIQANARRQPALTHPIG